MLSIFSWGEEQSHLTMPWHGRGYISEDSPSPLLLGGCPLCPAVMKQVLSQRFLCLLACWALLEHPHSHFNYWVTQVSAVNARKESSTACQSFSFGKAWSWWDASVAFQRGYGPHRLMHGGGCHHYWNKFVKSWYFQTILSCYISSDVHFYAETNCVAICFFCQILQQQTPPKTPKNLSKAGQWCISLLTAPCAALPTTWEAVHCGGGDVLASYTCDANPCDATGNTIISCQNMEGYHKE